MNKWTLSVAVLDSLLLFFIIRLFKTPQLLLTTCYVHEMYAIVLCISASNILNFLLP